MKSLLSKAFYFGLNGEKEFQRLQTKIRNVEWNAIVNFIPEESVFMDVGCGTGYSMSRAIKDKDCTCLGIDPSPNLAGVKHSSGQLNKTKYKIVEAVAENLPAESNAMDVVYSSHVLEHVSDEKKSLEEMHRVLKKDGVLVIGVPTATMAWIRLFTVLLFETHRNVLAILSWPFRPEFRKSRRLMDFVIPPSHGQPGKSIFFDLHQYRVKLWHDKISQYFDIQEVIYPALYSFPDYYQLFDMKFKKSRSSSVFFVCKPLK